MNVKMEPPMESDSMEDHSVNDDVPTEESEAEDTATRTRWNDLGTHLGPPGTDNLLGRKTMLIDLNHSQLQ